MNLKVLISHAHAERPLAEAWKALLEAVSGGLIAPWYSSDASGDGGMTIGGEWRETLREQIRDSQFVIAILSPASRDRPWILWECGVMNGLAQERAARGDDRLPAAVVPVIYSMSASDLSNPLSSFQVYAGDRKDKIIEICVRLAKEAGFPNPHPDLWEPALDKYMSAVAAHSPRRARTLDDMALWRTRIEQMIQAGRASEVPSLRQQMYTALGGGFQPLSIQLHDLLSKVMLETRHFAEAIEEANYGLSIDGDDVTLLYRKGLALAEQQDLNTALAVVNHLLEREPSLVTNTEIAGLLGRIYRDRYRVSGSADDLAEARNAYQRAAEAHGSDYYCALNAAELAMAEGDRAGAEPLLNQALSAARDAQKARLSSYWADFTVGQILLASGDTAAALSEYERGLAREPAPRELARQSALKGALRMAELSGTPPDVRQHLREILL